MGRREGTGKRVEAMGGGKKENIKGSDKIWVGRRWEGKKESQRGYGVFQDRERGNDE